MQMLLSLEMDHYYLQETQQQNDEHFLTKPILEMALDFPRFMREIKTLGDKAS